MSKTLKFIHCSDLHLSFAERDYSLAVLAEVFELARREGAHALLVAGDLFDSYPDAEKLRAEFRNLRKKYSGEVVYIPGNHEELQMGKGQDFGRLDLGEIRFVNRPPSELIRIEFGGEGVEILAIPHQNDYSSLQGLKLPEKRGLRIALAHASVPELIEYAGPSEEENAAGSILSGTFSSHNFDYVALGHIHGAREIRDGETLLRYAGSARVWRRGEAGPRGATLVTWNGRIGAEHRELLSAGCYRQVAVPVTFEGGEGVTEAASREWGVNDFVELALSGVVEDERSLVALEEDLRKRYSHRLRRLDITRREIGVLGGISSEPLVRKFLELWEAQRPQSDSEREVWLRAREIALGAVSERLKRR
jgi:DNA repair exonuclease SbcCD nuclease subunit